MTHPKKSAVASSEDTFDVLRAVDEKDRRRLEAATNGVFYDLAFARHTGVAHNFFNHVILETES